MLVRLIDAVERLAPNLLQERLFVVVLTAWPTGASSPASMIPA
jgi:hypothetical protein